MANTPTTGYADVNGLHLYHEVQGAGSPLVLLHGGMMTIDLSWGPLLPFLADRYRVVALEARWLDDRRAIEAILAEPGGVFELISAYRQGVVDRIGSCGL